MTFEECLTECLKNRELVATYNRLQGTRLLVPDARHPLVKMVDEATGYQVIKDKETERAMHGFIGFVYFYVWLTYCRKLAFEECTI